MANHTINITRTGTTLSVSSDPETVKPNHKLRFSCAEDFVVMFKNARNPHTPSKGQISGNGGTNSTFLKVRKLTTSEKLFPGDPTRGNKFSYGVSVLAAPSGPIVTLDPDIIIDDGGGGGTPIKKKPAKKKKR